MDGWHSQIRRPTLLTGKTGAASKSKKKRNKKKGAGAGKDESSSTNGDVDKPEEPTDDAEEEEQQTVRSPVGVTGTEVVCARNLQLADLLSRNQ